MRGQRPALASVLAWLALLAMLFTGLPVLERTLSGSAALVLQQPAEDRPASGGETTPQEETPAKPRRTAAARTASAPQPPRLQPQDALYSLMASLVARPPQASPAIVSAPATPLPAAPGLRVQRGQAPPPG